MRKILRNYVIYCYNDVLKEILHIRVFFLLFFANFA